MGQNEYGLDVSYFKSKLERVLQGIDRYTPDEMSRELGRMSETAGNAYLDECKTVADLKANLDLAMGEREQLCADGREVDESLAVTRNQANQLRDSCANHRVAAEKLTLERNQLAAQNALLIAAINDNSVDVREYASNLKAVAQKSPAASLSNIRAEAVIDFASTMVGAFEAGFVDTPVTTVGAIYEVARHHVKNNFQFEAKSIYEELGEEFSNECFAGVNALTAQNERLRIALNKSYTEANKHTGDFAKFVAHTSDQALKESLVGSLASIQADQIDEIAAMTNQVADKMAAMFAESENYPTNAVPIFREYAADLTEAAETKRQQAQKASQ